MDNCNNISKVPFDPGWNDPPNFSYSTQQTAPSRPRNFLNKRVAFPLSGTTSSPAGLPTVNLPPVPSVTPIPAQTTPRVAPTDDLVIDSETTLAEVKGILLQFLENSSELGPKANGIKKKICVMEEMWSNGKLNRIIHAQMKDLAYALKDDQPSKADDIHRALMVDYVSAVGAWMPGVKQLVHHCIARSELLAIDKEY